MSIGNVLFAGWVKRILTLSRENLKNYQTHEYFFIFLRNRFACTLHHPVGTASMGAVVDPQLRVYGVKNLRVIDASIQPVIVVTNTQASTLMIAEKGADMIMKYWAHQPLLQRPHKYGPGPPKNIKLMWLSQFGSRPRPGGYHGPYSPGWYSNAGEDHYGGSGGGPDYGHPPSSDGPPSSYSGPDSHHGPYSGPPPSSDGPPTSYSGSDTSSHTETYSGPPPPSHPPSSYEPGSGSYSSPDGSKDPNHYTGPHEGPPRSSYDGPGGSSDPELYRTHGGSGDGPGPSYNNLYEEAPPSQRLDVELDTSPASLVNTTVSSGRVPRIPKQLYRQYTNTSQELLIAPAQISVLRKTKNATVQNSGINASAETEFEYYDDDELPPVTPNVKSQLPQKAPVQAAISQQNNYNNNGQLSKLNIPQKFIPFPADNDLNFNFFR